MCVIYEFYFSVYILQRISTYILYIYIRIHIHTHTHTRIYVYIHIQYIYVDIPYIYIPKTEALCKWEKSCQNAVGALNFLCSYII